MQPNETKTPDRQTEERELQKTQHPPQHKLSSMSNQRHPVNIQIAGAIEKDTTQLYMTTVLWSDQNEVTVYRSLNDFKKLNRELKKKFPPSNSFNRSTRIIPTFKAAGVYINMQIRGPSKSVLRLKALEGYCGELLKSDPRICKSSELINFLNPKALDLNPDFAKNCIVIMPSEVTLGSDKTEESNGVTQPFVTETYRCVATYETKDTKNRPFKVEVDEVVDVLIKDQKGWWLVENNAKHLAWFPAPYLERAEMGYSGPDVMDNGSVFYVATKCYKAMNSDEISVEIGSVVEVLQKSDNGWWIVRCNRTAGYLPSMYLQPYNNPRIHMMETRRELISPTLDMVQLPLPEQDSLQVSSLDLGRSHENLPHLTIPPLHPEDQLMLHSLNKITSSSKATSPIQGELAQTEHKSSLSDDSGEFNDESSYSSSDSPSRSETEETLYKIHMLTNNLSPEATGEDNTSLRQSAPWLNKMPTQPKVPPRPQAQEIIKRCTTVTRKNLQKNS
ncbi:hypothetical protein DNTS_001240 [Danionella cerebrum]|uniref:SH3 domain-containing protein n=1 Tax=Danionella cerebrum TaxID=2873325 RepID=A0A553R9W2_9TELE|nr:hypothetical protein DNTS_001240 [Danionella translucida]